MRCVKRVVGEWGRCWGDYGSLHVGQETRKQDLDMAEKGRKDTTRYCAWLIVILL